MLELFALLPEPMSETAPRHHTSTKRTALAFPGPNAAHTPYVAHGQVLNLTAKPALELDHQIHIEELLIFA